MTGILCVLRFLGGAVSAALALFCLLALVIFPPFPPGAKSCSRSFDKMLSLLVVIFRPVWYDIVSLWKKLRRTLRKNMKTVIVYTDGDVCFAKSKDVPTRSPLARQPLGDDNRPRL